MIIIEKLPEFREKIFDNVKNAAQKADLDALTKWTEAAKKCEKLIQENNDLENRVKNFVKSLWPEYDHDPNIQIKNDKKSVIEKKISAKERGRIEREKWVENRALNGIKLYGSGKYYHTKSNKSVAIAFATELTSKPQLENKWFLGIKEKPTDIVVLLCRDREGYLYDFILPINTLGKIWDSLSRSEGEIKFHIQKINNDFMMLIPGTEPTNITKYIENYQVFTEIIQ